MAFLSLWWPYRLWISLFIVLFFGLFIAPDDVILSIMPPCSEKYFYWETVLRLNDGEFLEDAEKMVMAERGTDYCYLGKLWAS